MLLAGRLYRESTPRKEAEERGWTTRPANTATHQGSCLLGGTASSGVPGRESERERETD